MADHQVIIVGAGVAGLVAAYELEKLDVKPLIVEASDRSGGRVKTDDINGYRLDHGFQVLLTAYPEAKKYLDYKELDLQYFEPGAFIYEKQSRMRLADPTRQPGLLFTSLFSKAATLADKIKVFKLSGSLKSSSIDAIFSRQEKTTMQYLQDYGFSDEIINKFFRPFFGGIFLENELSTSSRMFEFVFKMFSEGHAAIPAKGMEEIPKQLQRKLKTTDFLFNFKVTGVENQEVRLDDGNVLTADAIIIATQPDDILPKMKGQFSGFQKVTNLYFETEQSFIGKSLIGLVPDQHKLINNLCFLSDTSPLYASNGKALLSVSVNGIRDESEETLIQKVSEEISEIGKIPAGSIKFLKAYYIHNALPVIDDLHNEMYASETKIFNNVFLAGDYLLNGSLNAAMSSGRSAALAAKEYLLRNN